MCRSPGPRLSAFRLPWPWRPAHQNRLQQKIPKQRRDQLITSAQRGKKTRLFVFTSYSVFESRYFKEGNIFQASALKKDCVFQSQSYWSPTKQLFKMWFDLIFVQHHKAQIHNRSVDMEGCNKKPKKAFIWISSMSASYWWYLPHRNVKTWGPTLLFRNWQVPSHLKWVTLNACPGWIWFAFSGYWTSGFSERGSQDVSNARISRIGNYRPAFLSAASLGARGISCTELPGALSISRRNGVVPIGNDAISPRVQAMTKMKLGFADPANPWSNGTTVAF